MSRGALLSLGGGVSTRRLKEAHLPSMIRLSGTAAEPSVSMPRKKKPSGAPSLGQRVCFGSRSPNAPPQRE